MNINSNFLKLFRNDYNLRYALDIFKNKKLNLNSKISGNKLQNNILNFYNKHTISPYVPLVAKGPWIITSENKVIYDVGGYGMLGHGHSPHWIYNKLKKHHVMANVMTPSYEQFLFVNKLKEMIGNPCPYTKFAFLNSGSEAMELAGRIVDTFGKKKDVSKKSKYVVLKNGFHGRTSNASLYSNSCYNLYRDNLKSYMYHNFIETVTINDSNDLLEKIIKILNDGYLIDAFIMEPVMGEGNPGIGLTPEYYNLVRKVSLELNSLLIIDSVQAGIRTNGCLSIVDYPGFNNEEPPDMEIFSKAINSGYYPLSVLAMKDEISKIYEVGTYGNTMCANPKALDIGYETLNRLTPEVSENIVIQGNNFKKMLIDLKNKYPEIITNVTGTGLLIAAHINKKYPVVGDNNLEMICRYNGLNVIHGGENALRFTPYFLINENEINLIKNILMDVFNKLEI